MLPPTVAFEDINFKEALYITIWDSETEKDVVAYGPFELLDDALSAVGPIRDTLTDSLVLLMTGVDEIGDEYDADEPAAGQTAERLREEARISWEEHCALVAAEQRVLYGPY